MTLRNKDKPMERVDDIHEHCPLNRGGWETAARVPTKDIVNKVSWTKIGNGVPLSRQIHLMYFLMEGITLREIYCVTVIWIRISRGAAILRRRLHFVGGLILYTGRNDTNYCHSNCGERFLNHFRRDWEMFLYVIILKYASKLRS